MREKKQDTSQASRRNMPPRCCRRARGELKVDRWLVQGFRVGVAGSVHHQHLFRTVSWPHSHLEGKEREVSASGMH